MLWKVRGFSLSKNPLVSHTTRSAPELSLNSILAVQWAWRSSLPAITQPKGMSLQQLASHSQKHAGKDDIYKLTKNECSKLIDTLKGG